MRRLNIQQLIDWNKKQGKHYGGTTLYPYYIQSSVELQLLMDLYEHINELPIPSQNPDNLQKIYTVWIDQLERILP